MKKLILAFAMMAAIPAFAADTINFNFKDEELTKMISAYSSASGQKFVIDPAVRGKATILLPGPVSKEEAFNQLSSALALNGFAISKQGDTMVIMSARNIQRNLVETTTTLPELKPERMVTYIVTLKNVSAENVNRNLRIIPSKDGELSVLADSNQIIMTDWASNIHRVAEMFKEVDKKPTAEVTKLVNENKKTAKAASKKDPKFKSEE